MPLVYTICMEAYENGRAWVEGNCVRGGSLDSAPYFQRSAIEFWDNRDDLASYIGFRLVYEG